MRLFVTGATGVVGRRAVPLLLSQGHSVTAGVRQAASRVSVVARKDLDYVPVDLFDLPSYAGLWPVTMQSSILRLGCRHQLGT